MVASVAHDNGRIVHDVGVSTVPGMGVSVIYDSECDYM